MPAIQDLSGKTTIKPGEPGTKSRINPKSIRVSIEQFQNAIAGIDRAVSLVEEMKAEVGVQVRP